MSNLSDQSCAFDCRVSNRIGFQMSISLRRRQVLVGEQFSHDGQIDKRVDLISIIDSVVPRRARESGPSVGEYFLYEVPSRVVEEPTQIRAQILRAFGHRVSGGVLQTV